MVNQNHSLWQFLLILCKIIIDTLLKHFSMHTPYSINRSVAIIRLKQPFVDWANQLPDARHKVWLNDLQEDCTVVLIPEYDNKEEAKEYIDKIAENIFDNELFSWCTNEDWWPQKRTKAMFWKWFDIELYSTVIDSSEEAIVKEEE